LLNFLVDFEFKYDFTWHINSFVSESIIGELSRTKVSDFLYKHGSLTKGWQAHSELESYAAAS